MPYYLFEHSDTQEVHEIWFHMNDDKVYNGPSDDQNGKWKRVWTVPQAAIATRIDPYSTKDFVTSTSNKKGITMGQMWEKSAEMSKKREDKEGIDPVKAEFYKNYQKSTGLKNINQVREDTGIRAKEFVKNLGLRS